MAVRNAAGPSHKWRRPTGLKRPLGSTRPTASAEPAPQAPLANLSSALWGQPVVVAGMHAHSRPASVTYPVHKLEVTLRRERTEEGEEEEER